MTTKLNPGLLDLSGSSIMGRNKIINGNFDIWQRGTSLVAATGGRYLADRWRHDGNGSTISASQQAFTLGQTAVPFEPAYFNRSVVSSVAGAGNYAWVIQSIEGVRTLSGQVATLTFWAKSDVNRSIVAEIVQRFGTGGSPSADSPVSHVLLNLTTSWQKFTFTVSMPTLAGKTIGTNGDDCVQVIFWFDAGSNFSSRTSNLGQQSGTFDIAQVQLERGQFATDFEVLHIADVLKLCQRYFFLLENGIIVQGYQVAGWGIYQTIIFPVRMRATPTATSNWSGGTNNASQSVVDIAPSGAQLLVSASASAQTSATYNGGNTFSAEL